MASRVLKSSEVIERDLWLYGMHKAGLISERAFVKFIWHVRCARDPFFKDEHTFEAWSKQYVESELPAMIRSRRQEEPPK